MMENTKPTGPDQSQTDLGSDDAVLAEVDALSQQLAKAESTIAEMRDTLLRERAEIENQRRRLQRDLDQARRFANEKLLAELLPVCDGLERGLAVEGGDVASLREGMDLTLKALVKVAENNGLKAVDPTGQTFNPEQHQAMSMVDNTGQASGTVVSTMQKGYVLNDRLLRPALVVVAK
jgi:molecular chaperone GrpE